MPETNSNTMLIPLAILTPKEAELEDQIERIEAPASISDNLKKYFEIASR